MFFLLLFFQLFSRALAEVRKQAAQDDQDREDPDTTANERTPEVLNPCRHEQQEEENISLQKKLSSTQTELKSPNPTAKEEIERRDRNIKSLHQKLLDLQSQFNEAMDSCIRTKRELRVAEEMMKKKNIEICYLKHSLQAQKKEMEVIRDSLWERDSRGCQTSQEDWKREINQLKELLTEKEQFIEKVKQRGRRRTIAYIDTLNLLARVKNALQQQQQKCAALEAEVELLWSKC